MLAALLTSELKTALRSRSQSTSVLIIDLVVASVLMSMGMMMLADADLSAVQILLFVLVDGWVLIVGSLAASFNPL